MPLRRRLIFTRIANARNGYSQGATLMSVARSPKVYIEVIVRFLKDGGMRPVALIWDDDIQYVIDRVLDVRPSYAAKAGGQGDRYTVMVGGKQKQLFFEHSADSFDQNVGRWFVELKR